MKCIFNGAQRKAGRFEKDGKEIVYDNYYVTLSTLPISKDWHVGYESFVAKVSAKNAPAVFGTTADNLEALMVDNIMCECECEFNRYGNIDTIVFER